MMLLEKEYQLKMQLEGMVSQAKTNIERTKEDRKDDRTKIQATQQSELIDQRQTGKPPKNFEKDTAMEGLDLGL